MRARRNPAPSHLISGRRCSRPPLGNSRQSHQGLRFSPEVVARKNSRGVRGTMEPAAARQLLLKDSGLAFSVTPNGAMLVGASRKSLQPLKTRRTHSRKPGALFSRFRALCVRLRDWITATQTPAVDEGSRLTEIVVTAQKRAENLQNVPISIAVLSGANLDRSTAEGVSEALSAVPGVAIQQNYLGGGTVIAIRGVAPSFTFESGASPVAYYLDSVPFGLVKTAFGPDADGFDLARVEVMRGPQGTLYGASALNGVVRVITNDADLSDFDLKARGSHSYTEYGGNNNRVDMAVNVPIVEDKLAIRAVGGYENNDGWINQPIGTNVNWTEIGTFRVKLNAQPIDNLSIGLSAWSSRSNSGAPNTGITFDRNLSLVAQPAKTDYDAYSAKVVYQLAGISVTSATSYLDYANSGSLGLDVDPFDAPGTTFINDVSSHLFSEELTINSPTSGPWRWSLGGMYRRATEGALSYFEGSPFEAEEYTDVSKSYAAFGELTRLLLDGRLEVTAGFRHFHDDISQTEEIGGSGSPVIPPGTPVSAAASWPRPTHRAAS